MKRRTPTHSDAHLEAQVAGRLRTALELHDSLLQGFQGLVFRLQAVRDLLPDRTADAARMLDDALDHSDKVLVEAERGARNLREASVSARTAE